MLVAAYVLYAHFVHKHVIQCHFAHGRSPSTRYADVCVQCNVDKITRFDLPNFHLEVAVESNKTLVEDINESPIGNLPLYANISSIIVPQSS